jgi:predicted nucleic acid-binding protein
MSRNKPTCYIDSNIIIEYVKFSKDISSDSWENEIEFIEKILQSAKDGSIRLVTSVITKLECTHIGDSKYITDDVKNIFRSILDSGEVLITISIHDEIAKRAREMKWAGFPFPSGFDKIHIASAIEVGCCEIISLDGFERDNAKKKSVKLASKNSKERIADDACVQQLQRQYGIEVVFPSDSVVARREYKLHGEEVRHKAKIKKTEEDKARKAAYERQRKSGLTLPGL